MKLVEENRKMGRNYTIRQVRRKENRSTREKRERNVEEGTEAKT